MGYVCPVCAAPQRDGDHLANHLAFTAMLHGDEHETWLDEHVADWAETNRTELAALVTEYAEPSEYDEFFEDTVHDHDAPDRAIRPLIDETGSGALDGEARAVLSEARELTERMLSDDETGSTDADETADADNETADADNETADADEADGAAAGKRKES
ncbi:DUF5810 domain-containing protein [Haloferacaceae archaeon DSL9]